MEPVERADDARQHVNAPVVAADVLDFVGEGPAKVTLGPGLRVGRQHDRRAHDPYRERRTRVLSQQRFDRARNASVPGKIRDERITVRPRRPRWPASHAHATSRWRSGRATGVSQRARRRAAMTESKRPVWPAAVLIGASGAAYVLWPLAPPARALSPPSRRRRSIQPAGPAVRRTPTSG